MHKPLAAAKAANGSMEESLPLPQRRRMLSSEGSAGVSTAFRLLWPEALYAEIVAQARAELPNECCGLLAGRIVDTPSGRAGQVVRRYPLINAAASPVEYLSEPKSMFHAVRDMDRHELEL